jgi:hypothetical protein
MLGATLVVALATIVKRQIATVSITGVIIRPIRPFWQMGLERFDLTLNCQYTNRFAPVNNSILAARSSW